MHAPQSLTIVNRYSGVAQIFHWLTALLVIIAYIVSIGGPEVRVYSPTNDFSRDLHELLGMSVFALTAMRMCWRAIASPPKSAQMPAWMSLPPRRRSGRFPHFLSWCQSRPF